LDKKIILYTVHFLSMCLFSRYTKMSGYARICVCFITCSFSCVGPTESFIHWI
jgi:hypothetical protein